MGAARNFGFVFKVKSCVKKKYHIKGFLLFVEYYK